MWPDDQDLQLEVHAAFGADPTTSPGSWSWTNLSARLQPEPIRLRAGKSGGTDHVSPGTCTVTLDNDDAALTPLHPLSAYWPNVRRGTPLRVRVFWGGLWYTRFAGFADQWEPEFLATTTPGQASSRVRVTASGLLRRLEQGGRPLFSTPRRYIPTTSPVAYWPLEDGQLASEGAAVVGSQPMRPFVGSHPAGNVVTFTRWGRGDLAPWLLDAVSRAGSAGLTAIWAPVSMPAVPGRWVIDFMYRSGTDAGDATVDVNPSYLPGGALGWPQLLLLPSVRGVDVTVNGEPEVNGTAATLYDGLPHHVRWDVYQDGARVSWNAYVDGTMVNFGTTSGSVTLPSMSTLAFTANAQAGADMVQGHIAVWTSPPPLPNAVAAAFGYAGETAAARITRLCAEEGVTVTVGSGESEPLGPQSPGTLVELLREAEDADMGLLYESGFALAYSPRGDRYNAAPLMTIDLAQYLVARGGSKDVLSPIYDDQALRNEWTVGRPDSGQPRTAVDTAHQSQVGVYADSAELNLASDGRLLDHAAWRVYLGTVDELREGTFPLDLAANPGLLGGWLACQVGSRVIRTNPPAQYQPGPLDRLVDGWTETIGPRSWMAQVTPSPANPWDVATVNGDPRVAADGSMLAADLSSSGTSLLLSSTLQNGPWTTDPTDFPLAVEVGGERVTVSSIAPAVTDAFGRTVSSSWGTSTSGPAWTTTGGSAADYSVASGVGRQSLASVNVLRTAYLDAGSPDVEYSFDWSLSVGGGSGAPITLWFMIRFADLSNYYSARVAVSTADVVSVGIDRRVAGTPITIVTPVAVGTNTAGTLWRTTVKAKGSLLIATCGLADGRPPAASVSTTDTSLTAGTQIGVQTRLDSGNTNSLPVTASFDNLTVTNPQRVTVSARAVNGVSRAWPAGTAVDVWQPAISAL